MRKKALLVWLWMLVSILLGSGCAPSMTYDQMGEAYEVATDPEEKKKLGERLERFERDAERADDFFRLEALCPTIPDHAWMCSGARIQVQRKVGEFSSIEERVRAYRRLRSVCGCASIKEVLNNTL